MDTITITRTHPSETIREGDGCRNGRPQPRERGSRHNRVQRAVRESLAR